MQEGPRYPGSLVAEHAKWYVREKLEERRRKRGPRPPKSATRIRLETFYARHEGLALLSVFLLGLAKFSADVFLDHRYEEFNSRHEMIEHLTSRCESSFHKLQRLKELQAFWAREVPVAGMRGELWRMRHQGAASLGRRQSQGGPMASPPPLAPFTAAPPVPPLQHASQTVAHSTQPHYGSSQDKSSRTTSTTSTGSKPSWRAVLWPPSWPAFFHWQRASTRTQPSPDIPPPNAHDTHTSSHSTTSATQQPQIQHDSSTQSTISSAGGNTHSGAAAPTCDVSSSLNDKAGSRRSHESTTCTHSSDGFEHWRLVHGTLLAKTQNLSTQWECELQELFCLQQKLHWWSTYQARQHIAGLTLRVSSQGSNLSAAASLCLLGNSWHHTLLEDCDTTWLTKHTILSSSSSGSSGSSSNQTSSDVGSDSGGSVVEEKHSSSNSPEGRHAAVVVEEKQGAHSGDCMASDAARNGSGGLLDSQAGSGRVPADGCSGACASRGDENGSEDAGGKAGSRSEGGSEGDQGQGGMQRWQLQVNVYWPLDEASRDVD